MTTTIDMTPPTYLDQSDIGELVGRPGVYVRSKLRPLLPEPDVYLGTTAKRPGWLPATITAWCNQHPEELQVGGTWTQRIEVAG